VPNYMLLLYSTTTDWEVGDDTWDDGIAEHEAFVKAVEEAGAEIVSAAALAPPQTARTVRGADRVVSDGPFAEVREVLGGYYMISAPDLDTALALAKQCPEEIVEVREEVG
jgi:hypothetical protein